MNAPLLHGAVAGHHAARLSMFAFFHLNLAFSSIEEEQRPQVIERCYWPLLQLAQAHRGLGIEVSGYTLEEIQRLDPDWVGRVRRLVADGRIELIGSGYSQMIGPLVPARVIRENLRIGNDTYRELLGIQPSIALINEQAFSAGLVEHYLDAGYQAILMDWDNPSAHHPAWNSEFQYLPQFAAGLDGRKIPVLWSSTTAFQQMQRLIHGDISLESYLRFIRQRQGPSQRALCIYASDAEIFNFRPGRFRTEERLAEGEWQRWREALSALAAEPDVGLVTPSEALGLMKLEQAGNVLELQSPHCPVPVKKQPKYNLARWAVSGRDNTAINAACERIHQGMLKGQAGPADWKELCYLWSSDFRTHLTHGRWSTFRTRLKAADTKWSHPHPRVDRIQPAQKCEDRHITIETPMMEARLDRRRGLAIEWLRFDGNPQPILGGLPHGYFNEIALQADWYTGDSVFEAPGEHKVTDLEWCHAHMTCLASGDVVVEASIETPRGPIEKRLLFSATERQVDFDVTFHWDDWGKGILRLGHFTLLPEAFALEQLSLSTTNGGGPETYCLENHTIDHGAPVSALVSSSFGLGMSEGWAEIGDDRTRLRIEVDRTVAPLLGLLTHRPARRANGSPSVFCQLQLSALELDDTRRPANYEAGPRRFRFCIKAVPKKADSHS